MIDQVRIPISYTVYPQQPLTRYDNIEEGLQILTPLLREYFYANTWEQSVRENIRYTLLQESARYVLAYDTQLQDYIGLGSLHGNHLDPEFARFGWGFVREEYRRQGIFSEIALRIEKIAIDQGYTRLEAFVNQSSAGPLLRLGWEDISGAKDRDITLQKILHTPREIEIERRTVER